MLKSLYIGLALILAIPGAHALQADATSAALAAALDAQDAESKARFEARHPGETLRFFGIEPGMKVVEVLPGGGWYSKILLPFLGQNGALMGVDYNLAMWPNFSFATKEWIEKRKGWATTWPQDAKQWGGDNSASVSAMTFGAVPQDSVGTFDAVLFIRALHNLARYESKGGFLTGAFRDAYTMLKPGGVVGIVQHEALADRNDAWADGSNGYLKKSFVIEKMKQAGFEFVDEFAINENPKDQAKEGDVVWRLPPSLGDSQDDDKRKADMLAIGESNRMTLLFRKPPG